MAELVETPQAHDQGRKGRGRCGERRQSRDGEAYLLGVLAGGTHRLHCPKSAKGEGLHRELSSPFIITPTTPPGMYVEGDKSVLGAEVLYVVLGIVLLVLMAGIIR